MLVNSRIIVSRTFQNVLGQLAMGRFISYSGKTASTDDVFELSLDRLLKSYVYFVGLVFLLNYGGEAIYRSPLIRDWFNQFDMAKVFFLQREAEKWSPVGCAPYGVYRDKVLATMGYSKPLYDEFNPRESLLNVERYKSSRLLEIAKSQNLSEYDQCLLPEKYLKDSVKQDWFFTISQSSVPQFSVFIGLDYCIIMSYLYLSEIYRKAVSEGKGGVRIPAWFKYQSARITDAGDFKLKSYFDNWGKIAISLPAPVKEAINYAFNTYGLKMTVSLPPKFSVILFREPWDLLSNEPPELAQYIGEPWDLESSEPPELTQYSLEPWSSETSEPPELELLDTEIWGEAEPEWSLLVIEPWYVQPPSYQQHAVEHWSS